MMERIWISLYSTFGVQTGSLRYREKLNLHLNSASVMSEGI